MNEGNQGKIRFMSETKQNGKELEKQRIADEAAPGIMPASQPGSPNDAGHAQARQAEQRAAHMKQTLLAIRGIKQLMITETEPMRLIERACANLTRTLGFHHAWIALMPEPGQHIMITASSGFNGEFEAMRENLERGEYAPCIRRILDQEEFIIVNDPPNECPDCPLATQYASHAKFSHRLSFQGHIYGILSVSIPRAYAGDSEEQNLFREIAGDLGFALRKMEDAETLRRSEEKFEKAFQNAPHAITITRAEDGKFVDVNPAFSTIFGYSREEALANSTVGLNIWAAQHERNQVIALLLAGGVITGHETHFRGKNGEEIVGVLSAQVITLHNEPCLLSSIGDITRRKQVEEALHESEERFRALIMQSGDCLILHDLQGEILDVNPCTCQTYGYARDELLGMRVGLLAPDSTRQEDNGSEWEQLRPGVPCVSETGQKRKDGVEFPVEIRLSLIELHGQQLVMRLCRDISERKQAEKEKARLEDQYRQAQKMEAIGQLTGGVAHDFNNLLQVIGGATDLALEDLEQEHPVREQLEQVEKACQRAARLVSQLLAFSRRQIMRPETLLLNDTVADLLKMLGRVIGEHIQLQWLPSPQAGAIHADRGMIEQVLMNLCVNARDAMPDGGTLTIETHDALVDEDFRVLHSWAKPGRYALLGISDTGCGMDKETLGHIFEPFFTTKEKGKGTGLGLSMVYGIIKQHEGMIHAYSEPGRGSTFKLYWPQHESRSQAPEAPVNAVASNGTETILLAEDDEMVRKLAKTILERSGYTVLSAANGAEALALYEQYAHIIDLAVLDVVMPEMGGREAYECMRVVNPELKALFASGYSENAIHTNFILDKELTLIQKPFTTDTLLRAIRFLLD